MIITKKYLDEREADILEAKKRLINMPNFRSQKVHGLTLTSNGLKPYTHIENAATQKIHYIHDALCRGLYLTYEAPKSSHFKHLQGLREIFDDIEVLQALKILETFLKEVNI